MSKFENILNDFITDNNDVIGCLPISFDEYIYFLFPGNLTGNNYNYDKEKHCLLFQKVVNYFSYKAANLIHKSGIAFSFEKATKKQLFINPLNHIDAIKYSYNKVCSLPKQILSKIVGAGFTGLVLKYDNDRVIKILYNNICDKEYLFYKYQINNNLSIFPHVYFFNDNTIIMEKLITESEKLSLFKEYIERYVQMNFLEDISYRTLNTELESLPQDFRFFINDIRTALNDIYDINCIGDLKIDNIGIRPVSNEIVIFDPVGGYIKNYDRIIQSKR